MSQPELHGALMELGLEWCQGQLTGGSEKGKGVFHGGGA